MVKQMTFLKGSYHAFLEVWRNASLQGGVASMDIADLDYENSDATLLFLARKFRSFSSIDETGLFAAVLVECF